MLGILILKNHRSFGEELKYEIQDLFKTFVDFFTSIYESLCNSFGTDIVNLFGIAIGALIIMLVAMAIINR